jgi:lipopolysaccharide transport system ATP-binding protein
MWYGLKDLATELTGRGADRPIGKLRKGEFVAIQDANFQVRCGECFAMLGPNGAGKSTMLKMINGLIRPNAGSIHIRGKIGALIELGTGFNPILSGRENVYVNASVLGLKQKEVDRIFDDIVNFAELQDVINDPVKTYSSGMKVRLGYAVAANLKPDLLIMDEVLAVGDVGFRMKCFAHLKRLIEQGVAIILVSHSVSMLQRVATRGIVFNNGLIVHDGDLPIAGTVYEELVHVSREQGDPEKEKPRNMDGSIVSVISLNDRDQPESEFQTGDTVRLQVELKCSRPIEDARLIMALASPTHGVISAVSSIYKNVDLNLQTGGNSIVLQFRDLPLLVGSYHFNVSLYGPNTEDFYHRLLNQAPFRITGPPIQTDGRGIRGLVKLEHEWRVKARERN